MPSDQEQPPRWKNHPAEEWVCITVVPSALTSTHTHTHTHTRMCVCLCLCHSSLTGSHTAAPSRSWQPTKGRLAGQRRLVSQFGCGDTVGAQLLCTGALARSEGEAVWQGKYRWAGALGRTRPLIFPILKWRTKLQHLRMQSRLEQPSLAADEQVRRGYRGCSHPSNTISTHEQQQQ